MTAPSPVRTTGHGVPSIAARAAAILRDEIANGALANIAVARQRWPAVHRDLITRAATPGVAGIGGLIGDVLDLVVPSAPIPRAHSASSTQQPAPSVPVLTARRPAPRGGTAEIRTGVQNDGANGVRVGFLWGDLVAAPDSRIAASHLRFSPDQVRIGPGDSVNLTAVLDVPADARPGHYRVLVEAADNVGLFATLVFPVGIAH